MREIPWSAFKSFVQTRYLSIQYVDVNDHYYMWAFDGPITFQCALYKDGSSDVIDFEDNFKSAGNKSFSDIDGTPLARMKASKKDWSFWALPMEVTLSTLGGSLYAKDSSGTDIPGITVKIYDANNNEITTAGILNANLATCVKTVIDFEPSFDYELIGGVLRTNSSITDDVRLWIVGAPDIAAQYGGSKEFASGINLKFLAPDNAFEVDGRVTKYVKYSATTHSGKLRMIFKHSAGTSSNIQIIIHTYKA